MYVLGGFDGTRLNDMHLIAFQLKQQKNLISSSLLHSQTETFDETEMSVQNVTDIDEDL